MAGVIGFDSDFDFDSLLQEIRYGNVVPVIGSELYANEHGEPLEPLIAARLATGLGLPASESTSIRDLSLSYLATRGTAAYHTLKTQTRAAIQAVVTQPPASLRQLAEIATLPLYVTTTPDDMLEVALADANRAARSLAYREKPELDLPADLRRSVTPFVCHLFGSLAESFALTDADLLEYVQSLASELRSPRKLFDELSTRSLLFLGCGYPDWLARFFVRVMRKSRFGERDNRIQVVADASIARDARLMMFLRHYDLQLYPPGHAIDFVDQIHRRWKAAQTPPPRANADSAPQVLPKDAVFLSFSSLDRDDVRNIAAVLRAGGIDVFLDETNVEKGSDWDDVIIENLTRAVLFIPFVSKNTELDIEQPKYFRREWNLADKRAEYYAAGIRYILPVNLDAMEPPKARVPAAFKAVQWYPLLGRVATEEFVSWVRQEYRRKILGAAT